MRHFFIMAMTLSTLIVAPAAFSAAGSFALLPKQSIKAEFVQVVFDEKATDISRRLTEAWSKNQKALDAFAAQQGANGGGISWHPKMGISQAEFSYMIEKLKHPKFQKIADANLTVTRSGPWVQVTPEFGGLKMGSFAVDAESQKLKYSGQTFPSPKFVSGKALQEDVGRYIPSYEWKVGASEKSGFGRISVGSLPDDPAKCLLNLSVAQEGLAPSMGLFRYPCP